MKKKNLTLLSVAVILSLTIILGGCNLQSKNSSEDTVKKELHIIDKDINKVIAKEKEVEEIVKIEDTIIEEESVSLMDEIKKQEKDSVSTSTNSDTISTSTESNVSTSTALNKNIDAPVKEIIMTSFTEIKDGKYFPQYSVTEITVNKGDLVRIKVTVTKGTHDIKIDEFNVFAETPLNEEVTVEFIADKVGEFEYYCTKPGHRENGHWGTLKVI